MNQRNDSFEELVFGISGIKVKEKVLEVVQRGCSVKTLPVCRQGRWESANKCDRFFKL